MFIKKQKCAVNPKNPLGFNKDFIDVTKYLTKKVLSYIKRNWVFATNSDFLILISYEPNVIDLRYFKLWILLDQVILVWNIKGLHHHVAKIWGL